MKRWIIIAVLCALPCIARVHYTRVWRAPAVSAVTDPNLHIWLEFSDETACGNGDYQDSSIYNNDGTQAVANSRATWTNDSGGALKFDTDDYLTANSLVTELQTNTVGTISCWVKHSSTNGPSTYQVYIGATDSGDALSFLMLYYDETLSRGYTAFCYENGAHKYNTGFTGAPTGDVGTWHHLALVQAGVSPVLYVDGVGPYAIIGATVPSAWFSTVNNLDVAFVGAENSAGWAGYLYGTLDDAKIWNRALTSNEVYTLYMAGSTNGTGTH